MRVNELITEAWPGPRKHLVLKFFILDISGGHGYTSGPLIEVKKIIVSHLHILNK